MAWFTRRKEIDDATIEKAHALVSSLSDSFEDEDILSENNCFHKDGPVLPLLKKIADHFEEKETKNEDLVALYDDISNYAGIIADFDMGAEYAKKCVKIAEKGSDPAITADAYFSCSNCLLSAAFSIAASALDLIYSADNEEHAVDVPDEMKEKCEAYTAEAVDFFHQTYILYLKLAIEGAAKLGLVEADLANKLDDDHITETVDTLTNALDKSKMESEEMESILNYIMMATEMNKQVVLRDLSDV